MLNNKNITIPNVLTLTSAACGLLGIYLMLQDLIQLAIIFLVSCDIFDTLDGYVAKKFKMYSPIGKDLDSIVDAIVFLVPPFIMLLNYESLVLSLSSVLLVFAGTYRLARYNTETSVKGKVKGLIASQPSHYIYLAVLLNLNTIALTAICLISSIFMISSFLTQEKYTNWASRIMIATNLTIALFSFF